MKKVIFILFLLSLSAFKPKAIKAYTYGCGDPVPSAPKVWTTNGPGNGQITLHWSEVAYADRYAVAYGVQSGKYIYGADNIGGKDARSYTVDYLTPGVVYYFRMAAARGACSSGFSEEVMGVAGGAMVESVPVMGQAPSTGGATTYVESLQKATASSYSSGPVGKQMLRAYSGSGVGEVTLSWQHADNADDYHLVYGEGKGDFKYGALNIGKVTSFKVRYLVPGRTYYFALVPLVGGWPLYTTDQVRVVAGQPVEVVETTSEALLQPPVTKAPDVMLSPTPVATEGSQVQGMSTQEPIVEDGVVNPQRLPQE